MKVSELKSGDGIIIEGKRAVVIIAHSTASPHIIYETKELYHGRHRFCAWEQHMYDTTFDPEGPFASLNNFTCKRKDCAYSSPQIDCMTTLKTCPNCGEDI